MDKKVLPAGMYFGAEFALVLYGRKRRVAWGREMKKKIRSVACSEFQKLPFCSFREIVYTCRDHLVRQSAIYCVEFLAITLLKLLALFLSPCLAHQWLVFQIFIFRK